MTRSQYSSLALYSPVSSRAHAVHMEAIARRAKSSTLPVASVAAGMRGLPTICRRGGDRVFVQASGVANILALTVIKLRGRDVIYYLHEPHDLRTKLSRRNGVVKACVWQLMQRIECFLADVVVVSSERLVPRAVRTYNLRPSSVVVAPLLLPDPEEAGSRATRFRVTYLGRLDDRRMLPLFLDSAPAIARSGLRPTILSADTLHMRADPAVELLDGTAFSEHRKAEILTESAFVWNPRTHDISQSGVTADALRYGCALVLNEHDPEYDLLAAARLAYRPTEFVEDALPRYVTTPADTAKAIDLFDELHGKEAFLRYYVPLLWGEPRPPARAL